METIKEVIMMNNEKKFVKQSFVFDKETLPVGMPYAITNKEANGNEFFALLRIVSPDLLVFKVIDVTGDEYGITVREVKKLDHTGCQPFLVIFVDGFALYFSHVMYYGDHIIRVELKTTDIILPNQLIYEMAFFCKFNYSLALKMEHKLGMNAGLTNGVQFIELLQEESKDTAIRICGILKDTIESSEYNITEVNM